MIKVYRYNRSEVGKGKTKQTFHCFKSLLTTYVPLVIFCTSNYPMSCSFVSRQKNLLGEKSGHKKNLVIWQPFEKKKFSKKEYRRTWIQSECNAVSCWLAIYSLTFVYAKRL